MMKLPKPGNSGISRLRAYLIPKFKAYLNLRANAEYESMSPAIEVKGIGLASRLGSLVFRDFHIGPKRFPSMSW